MLDKVYFSNDHLTALSFFMLDNESLELEEKQLVLSHISSCSFCMERYVDSLTDDSLIEPSPGLSNRIMDVIHSEQNVKKNTKILVMQFAKLGVAVCLTMTIFFSGLLGFAYPPRDSIENDRQPAVVEHQPKPQEEPSGFFSNIADSINKGFYDFADQINLGFKGATKNGTK